MANYIDTIRDMDYSRTEQNATPVPTSLRSNHLPSSAPEVSSVRKLIRFIRLQPNRIRLASVRVHTRYHVAKGVIGNVQKKVLEIETHVCIDMSISESCLNKLNRTY